jgi:ABC-2 type transport system permease protein
MAKYWLIIKLVWIEKMTYRVNFCLEIVSSVVSSLILVCLWLAVYRSSSSSAIGDYSLADMVTYLLVGGVINNFLLSAAGNTEISQSIRDGTLSSLLLKPLSPHGLWLFRDIGSKAFLLLMGLIGYAVVFVFLGGYLLLPASPQHFLVFLFSVILAGLLQFLLFGALSLLSFWIENTAGIHFVVRVVIEVLGGAIIPLSLFPPFVEKVFLLLPFPFLVYFPMRVYLGKIDVSAMALELGKEAAWIAALGILNLAIWQRGIRGYVSMGD